VTQTLQFSVNKLWIKLLCNLYKAPEQDVDQNFSSFSCMLEQEELFEGWYQKW